LLVFATNPARVDFIFSSMQDIPLSQYTFDFLKISHGFFKFRYRNKQFCS